MSGLGELFLFLSFESDSNIKRLNCLFDVFGLCAGGNSS